ncbi:MAG: AAA family ATPase [Acidimicrobiia bacterium]|nr:AAA family ATPase [Acidimicrobiia bacterium]
MRLARAEHERILLAAVAAGDGEVVEHTGHGLTAVFPDPVGAVRAAVDGQRRLVAARSTLGPRMGLHTVPATPTAEDRAGPGPALAARVMEAGRGGQVLVSEAIASLVRHALPHDVGLVDLGERHLPGLDHPLGLWALQGAGLGDPAGPELASPSSGAEVLVGRDRELATLRAAFGTAAAGRPTIVLLVGEAGIGKTRLADEAAVLARAAGMRVLRGEADAAVRQPMELWRGVYPPSRSCR